MIVINHDTIMLCRVATEIHCKRDASWVIDHVIKYGSLLGILIIRQGYIDQVAQNGDEEEIW